MSRGSDTILPSSYMLATTRTMPSVGFRSKFLDAADLFEVHDRGCRPPGLRFKRRKPAKLVGYSISCSLYLRKNPARSGRKVFARHRVPPRFAIWYTSPARRHRQQARRHTPMECMAWDPTAVPKLQEPRRSVHQRIWNGSLPGSVDHRALSGRLTENRTSAILQNGRVPQQSCWRTATAHPVPR